jgi:hypothetical protein
MHGLTFDSKIKQPFDLKRDGYVFSLREKAVRPARFFLAFNPAFSILRPAITPL